MNEERKEVAETSDVLKYQTNLYKKIHKEVEIDDPISIHSVLGDIESKLSDKESQKLEGEITYTERTSALKNMKNNKSSGLDGFTVPFFFLLFFFVCFFF